jgi:anti-anti-sigma regulatory factor
MLKISKIDPVKHAVTLRLEGSIVGPWVQELKGSCEEVLVEGRSLRLRLTEVEYMDADGVALLGKLRSHGAIIIDPPPFVIAQLKQLTSSPKPR